MIEKWPLAPQLLSNCYWSQRCLLVWMLWFEGDCVHHAKSTLQHIECPNLGIFWKGCLTFDISIHNQKHWTLTGNQPHDPNCVPAYAHTQFYTPDSSITCYWFFYFCMHIFLESEILCKDSSSNVYCFWSMFIRTLFCINACRV